MKLTRPVAIICSIGNVELEIRQCLLGIFSNVEVGNVNLATSKVDLATWQSGFEADDKYLYDGHGPHDHILQLYFTVSYASCLSITGQLLPAPPQLTDPLPKELGNLPIFNQMDISHNNITDLIPSNYGQNVDPDLDISIVDFSNNMLTGPILLAMQNLRVKSFCPGNPGICSKPLPNNCT
ncbi:unnamed protein product [Sphagnum balticum]